MAKSAASKLFQGSAAPALKNTTNFIDAAIMNPETMMRNNEEKLLYHTRENQGLVDAGLIERENMMPKAYVDAGIANNIVQGDLYDAYANAKTRLTPSLQEKITLVDAGLDMKDISGSTKTGSEVRREGDYDNTYDQYRNTAPSETTVIDPVTGWPVKNFSLGTSNSESLAKSKITPEAAARLKSKNAIPPSVELDRNPKFVTNEEVLKTDLELLDSMMGQSGLNKDQRSIVNKVVEQSAMNTVDDSKKPEKLEEAIAQIKRYIQDLDPQQEAAITNTLINYNAKFSDMDVLDNSGNPIMANLRPDATNQVDRFKMSGGGVGRGTVLEFPRYVQRGTNKRFSYVPVKVGGEVINKLISTDYLNNRKEAMKRNYKNSMPKAEQFVFTMDPESFVVLDDVDVNPKGGGVIDYKAAKGTTTNGPLFSQFKARVNSDPKFDVAHNKDKQGTNVLLQSAGIVDEEGEFNAASPAVEKIRRQLDVDFDYNRGKGVFNSEKVNEFNSLPEKEQEAMIKFTYLNNQQPGLVQKYKVGDGEFDVNLTTSKVDYLSTIDRGGVSKNEAINNAAKLVEAKPLTINTGDGGAIDIPYGVGTKNGNVNLFATGPTGELISVEGGRTSDNYTTKNQINQLGNELVSAYGNAGLIPPNSSFGVGKKMNLVPVGGFPRGK